MATHAHSTAAPAAVINLAQRRRAQEHAAYEAALAKRPERSPELALIVGITIGTYSSIYVASNILLLMNVNKDDLAIPVKEGGEQQDLNP